MRHVNGVYSQAFNRRHGKVGHLFQGRFKAILVDRDSYLLEVCRYVELNPVRAGMVATPADWAWSLHGYLLGRDPASAEDVQRAQRLYAELVAAGQGVQLWDEGLNRQIYLGDDDFVQRMLDAASPIARRSADVPKPQRHSPCTLAQWLKQCNSREEALRRAHTESGLSMTALAAERGVSVARVSQLISKAERNLKAVDSPNI